MCKVLTLVKIKYRTHETQINPYLIYISILEQTHVEAMGKNMDAHGGGWGFLRILHEIRYDRCARSDQSLGEQSKI